MDTISEIVQYNKIVHEKENMKNMKNRIGKNIPNKDMFVDPRVLPVLKD